MVTYLQGHLLIEFEYFFCIIAFFFRGMSILPKYNNCFLVAASRSPHEQDLMCAWARRSKRLCMILGARATWTSTEKYFISVCGLNMSKTCSDLESHSQKCVFFLTAFRCRVLVGFKEILHHLGNSVRTFNPDQFLLWRGAGELF